MVMNLQQYISNNIDNIETITLKSSGKVINSDIFRGMFNVHTDFIEILYAEPCGDNLECLKIMVIMLDEIASLKLEYVS